MDIIDQNSALIAQETALVSSSSLIDGRTEIDRLAFLSNFAEVINFYDHNNKLNGNWKPFLLKDPVILLAHISKTKIDQFYKLYRDTCTKIEFCLHEDKISKDLVINVDHLFDQLTKLFVMLERWTYYMQQSTIEYELKKYIHHEVKYTYCKYFWAILSLRESLSRIQYRYRIKPVKYYLYDNFDKIIWKQNMDKSPYWDILGIAEPVYHKTKPSNVYQAIRRAGDKLFSFLEAVVAFAPKEYESVKILKGKFPDTLLIRTFVALLNNYNDQLNGIADKHLQFYYQDILKQSSEDAIPDRVMLFANLAKPDATFTLTAGTLFNGGFDEQKKPILFETLKNINLNPATVTGVYTLARVPGTANLTPIQKIEDPTTIQHDVDGRIKSWNFFGDPTVKPEEQPKVGFVISSPLLLLREGIRVITLTGSIVNLLNSSSEINLYLSTESDWFLIEKNALSFNENNLIITLQSSDPEVVPFLKNPENLEASWPMVKIEFDILAHFNNVMSELGDLNLQVTVSGMKNLQFYNDFGSISAKNPFEPFGPIPLLNSGFVLGSDEIFSKPISSFNIKMEWNNLPKDNFLTYYAMYNKYLNNQLSNIPWFKRVIKRILRKKIIVPPVFFNLSFTCEMQLLQESTWKNLMMFTCPTGPVLEDTLYLFSGTNEELEKSSQFYFHPQSKYSETDANPELGDPQLQKNKQFKFTADSTSGFMKIILSGNEYGFGSGIYPNVVAQVATYNAWMMSQKKPMSCLVPQANLPFSPKISSFITNYSATTSLSNSTEYPYQFFTYSGFSNQPVTLSPANPISKIAKKNKDIDQTLPILTNDLLLSTRYTGFLFLELDHLVPSECFNLYFGLTTDAVGRQKSDIGVSYYYLNEEGWNAIAVVADGTANFNCSGVVSMEIPTTISQQQFIGKDKKYWICIAANDNLSTFPSVILLKPNGFMTQRYSGGISTNFLPINSITKAQTLIPQITTITQPFPSFGGIGVENLQQLNQRVSLRLKTKDRAVSSGDYFRLIKKYFPTIFYTKTIYDKKTKMNTVYVVPKYLNWQQTNAFQPLVNQGFLDEINDFLVERSSGLTTLKTANFNLFPISVFADVQVETDFTCEGLSKIIIQAINLFLSPWIDGDQQKTVIDKNIQPAALAKLIKSIAGVKEVANVGYDPILPIEDGILVISSMKHQVNCSY